MLILGIESSCDETSAAVVVGDDNAIQALSNISSTSLSLHAKTGGVIPEIAAREQIKYILPVIKQALRTAGKQPEDLNAIAVTYGPGLIGSLLVGVETAKTLAYTWSKPIIPVNHLFGHIYANWIRSSLRGTISDETISSGLPRSASNHAIQFPAIALVVSGGHTDLVLLEKHGTYRWLGGTRDDAAGEAIDKIGREINFPYPSGPAFEQAAKKGNPKTYRFPRPVMYDKQYDFSFSGLKTAAIREIQKIKKFSDPYSLSRWATDNDPSAFGKRGWGEGLSQTTIANLARGVQDAIIDVLVYKTLQAAEEFHVQSILLSGGVSANQTLREVFEKKITEKHLPAKLYAPNKQFCTDNAAMIAAAAYFIGKPLPWQDITANPELYFD